MADNPQPQAKPKDDRQCRICLGGAEEEPELGRLIKPCHCKGSIRYVHVKCLNTWRKTSASNSSFWSCPQCKFRYSFARTKVLGWSTSPVVLLPTTLVLFLVLVFASSFVVSFFLPEVDDPSLALPPPAHREVDDSPYFSWSITPFGVANDVIRETIRSFAEITLPRQDDEAQYDPRQGTTRASNPYSKSRKSKSPARKRRDPRTPYSPSEDGPTLVQRLTRRFVYGLSLVGIVSFINLLITMSLFGPLQIVRARWIRGHNRREGAGGGVDIGTVIVIGFVVIGVARALYAVYTGSRSAAQYLLLRAENAILEVQDDSDDEEEEAKPTAPEGVDKADKEPDNEGEKAGEATKGTPAASSSKVRQRPPPLNKLDMEQDLFGEELPRTPGGWQEEWLIP